MREQFFMPLNSATLFLCLSVGLMAQTSSPNQASGNVPDSTNAGWHLEVSPYLWFAGAHGTVGAFGRNVSMHATPGDLLSHLDIGLMGSAEARHNRLLLNGDLMWIRLSDTRALPFPALSALSVDARVDELVWSSKVGYRVIDRNFIKADANVGARFWHLGEKLNFNPSLLGLSFNSSQNWADIVIGGRVHIPIWQKTDVSLLGDVGGWNATAKLDYQFAAILSYNPRPKWVLGAGYRYLFIDYRGSNASVASLVTSGALIGMTYRFR